MFCIHQTLEKQYGYETVHQLLTESDKAYDSVGREVLYIILIQFGIFMELVKLITMFN